MHTKFLSESWMEIYHSEDLGIDEKITLEWILRKWGGKGVYRIHVAEDTY